MDTSHLTQQVSTIISQLHVLFDEIGVPHHDRDTRESELFVSMSETLHNHLRAVTSEKHALIDDAKRIITSIQQMETALDSRPADAPAKASPEHFKVTFPLHDCLQSLNEQYHAVNRLHQERFEQVKKLVQALESYSSHLEPSFVQITLPPISNEATIPSTFDLSPAYITSVDAEFSRVYEEYHRRTTAVQQTSEEIVKLWAELGTPQAQTDGTIIQCYRDAPEQLGLHQADIKRLRDRKEKLVEEKKGREKRMKELRLTIEDLWGRLGIPEQEKKAFSAGNRGCGLRTINDLEDELNRLNELKRQNLHLFVEDARTRLHNLWDELFFSEEEAVEFTPMFCDVYSDALLSAHESEIARLEALKEQRASTLQLISKHRSLIKDREELAASSQDSSRLLLKPAKGERRDPTRLLREEKMRKRIAKELPKLEQELGEVLEAWEEEYGRSFLVFGERYLDVVAAAASAAAGSKSNPGTMRSKTPNGLPSAASRPPTAAGMAPTARSATLRTQPPPQAFTSREPSSTHHARIPTFTHNTHPSSRNPLSMSMPMSQRSPSKLPGRPPLSAMPNGGNSPERQRANAGSRAAKAGAASASGSLNKLPTAGPMLAPPPRMRNLFVPPERVAAVSSTAPTLATPASSHDDNCAVPSDTSSAGSLVRHVVPEDPYGKRQRDEHSAGRSPGGSIPRLAAARPAMRTQMQAQADHIRQVSTVASTGGSENWETYGDGEDEEQDAAAMPTKASTFADPRPPTLKGGGGGMAALRKLNDMHGYRGGIAASAGMSASTRLKPGGFGVQSQGPGRMRGLYAGVDGADDDDDEAF